MNKILRILMFLMFVSAIVANAGPSLSVTLDVTTPYAGATREGEDETIYTTARAANYSNDHLAEQLAAGGCVGNRRTDRRHRPARPGGATVRHRAGCGADASPGLAP